MANQIIAFTCSPKSIEIIENISEVELNKSEYKDFTNYVLKFKNNMVKIADLRNVWVCDK